MKGKIKLTTTLIQPITKLVQILNFMGSLHAVLFEKEFLSVSEETLRNRSASAVACNFNSDHRPFSVGFTYELSKSTLNVNAVISCSSQMNQSGIIIVNTPMTVNVRELDRVVKKVRMFYNTTHP